MVDGVLFGVLACTVFFSVGMLDGIAVGVTGLSSRPHARDISNKPARINFFK
jgi:hypothetical protein